MKFRKKPVVIDAEQWWPGKEIEGVEEIQVPDFDPKPVGLIATLEGNMTAQSGDWIITGIKGEKYPCKPDIFEMTYESVEEKPTGNKDLAGADALEVPGGGTLYEVTVTNKDGTLLAGATVWATLENHYAPIAIRLTDDNGRADFHLDGNVDYRWWLNKDGDEVGVDLRVEKK